MFGKENKNLLIVFVIILFSIIGLFFSTNNSSDVIMGVKDKIASPSPSKPQQVTITPSKIPEVLETVEIDKFEDVPQPSLPLNETNILFNKTYPVVKVIDGDTIDVNIDGKTERLRLIGIDTPETVDPRKSVQCFGIEASNKAKELLSGKFVSLEADASQGERDKYRRLLRYVFLPDGTNFNKYMISEGFAHEYTYDEPYKYQIEFKQAETNARDNNKGLWNSSTCTGNK